MKRSIFATAVVLILGFSTLGSAALIDNGGGLIYDTVQNITWYDPAPTPMTWDDAVAWAAHLNVGGVTGWSLPTTPGETPNYTNEGEMGYLYYNELGNTEGGPLAKKGPLTNLQAYYYWSGTAYADPYFAWTFSFNYGLQNPGFKANSNYALAVHPGDVGASVPIPGAILLFASGLAGLSATRRRFKKQVD